MVEVSRTLYDHTDDTPYSFKTDKGINEKVVRQISEYKDEPDWMLQKRLRCLKAFNEMSMPDWGPDLSGLDLQEITYFMVPDAKKNSRSWDEVPEKIKETFERLGIPEAERKELAGAGAQYDSRAVYHNLREDLEDKGVIFMDMDDAVQEHPELVKKHFMTSCISPNLHKFSALHGAVWSGGTFIYVPEGVEVKQPLQAYFRMNSIAMGQFEHTLIIVDDDAECHYIEGCSAPTFDEKSIHAGAVEVFVGENARMRYSSVENWSQSTYNLNTKRANAQANSTMEWISGNLGSGVTMLYPATVLLGEHARAEHLSIAYAGPNQNQDTGAKVYHTAPNTKSTIQSKSISKDGGITGYRGLVKIPNGMKGSKSSVLCDALMFDNESQSNTYPAIDVQEEDVDLVHEASVGQISEDQLFYLNSRGLGEEEALSLIVSGFIEPLVKELPLEYAMEMNKLIQLEMEGSLG
jgi:Fe-S cluster assembly protein SufB